MACCYLPPDPCAAPPSPSYSLRHFLTLSSLILEPPLFEVTNATTWGDDVCCMFRLSCLSLCIHFTLVVRHVCAIFDSFAVASSFVGLSRQISGFFWGHEQCDSMSRPPDCNKWHPLDSHLLYQLLSERQGQKTKWYILTHWFMDSVLIKQGWNGIVMSMRGYLLLFEWIGGDFRIAFCQLQKKSFLLQVRLT